MLDVDALATLADAKRASRDCADGCDGEGLITVYHADYDGQKPYTEEVDSTGVVHYRITRTTAYCACAAGRWLLANHQEDSKDVWSRMNDLYELVHPKNGSLWSTVDPTAPNISDGEVLDRKTTVKFLNEIVGPKGIAKRCDEGTDESWLMQFLVHMLRSGPVAIEKIVELAARQRHTNTRSLHRAGEALRVVKSISEDGKRLWSLPEA